MGKVIWHPQMRVRVGPINSFNLIWGPQIIEANLVEVAILGGLNNLCVDLQRKSQLSHREEQTIPTSEKDGYSILPGSGTTSLWSLYDWSRRRRTLSSLVSLPG